MNFMRQIVRKKRGIFTLLLLIGLCGVVVVVVSRRLGLFLPSPKSCSQAQLISWLVFRDLSEESIETKLALLDRFQEELKGGLKANHSSSALSEKHRQRLQNNIEILQHLWFTSRVEIFSTLPASARDDYLDEQIVTIFAWSSMDLSPPGEFDPENIAQGSRRATASFFDQIGKWIVQASSEEKKQMNMAVQAGLIRWLATQDLSQETLQTRRVLARRITTQLEQGLQLAGIQGSSSHENQQLLANGFLLVEAWLYDCVDEYHKLPQERREKYVDRLIDSVTRWRIIEFLMNSQQNEPVSMLSSWFRFMKITNQWIQRADEKNRSRMRVFVNTFQRRLIVYGLQKTTQKKSKSPVD